MRRAVKRLGHVVWIVAVVALLVLPSGARAGRADRSSAAEAVVQFDAAVPAAERRVAVRAVGGVVTRDLHVIHALGVRLSPAAASRLAGMPGVRAVTPNAAVRSAAGGRWAEWNPAALATAFVQSTRTDKAWTDPKTPATGAGVGVAVIDTGIAGDLADFRDAASGASRVVASVVTNPDATTAGDRYGHGTHVAGLIAGNGRALATTDPLYNRYLGTAPNAKLVSIKVSDDDGQTNVIDVIAGLQFVVDHGADYGVRVVNLSLGSSLALSYRLDPLDAAVEAAWRHGITVVAAAGNRGGTPDAVAYAPANDPYVITVGAIDDHATKDTEDDSLAPWSSRGITQDGFAKPDLVAPGMHIAAPLAPDSDYRQLCQACVLDDHYFRVSGTSMAAPIVAGIAADLLSVHPTWTPDQVKGALTYKSPPRNGARDPDTNLRATSDGNWEVAADKALKASAPQLLANQGLTPSSLIDPRTGAIDPARASWGQATWAPAGGALRASWGAASWTCDCASMTTTNADPTRASWGRASWGTASWTSFLGETPDQYGELRGGASGHVPHGDNPSNRTAHDSP
jgi:serine protease AprX